MFGNFRQSLRKSIYRLLQTIIPSTKDRFDYAKWKAAPLTQRQKAIVEKQRLASKEDSIALVRYVRNPETGHIEKLDTPIPYLLKASINENHENKQAKNV
jgi:hypothetical protein